MNTVYPIGYSTPAAAGLINELMKDNRTLLIDTRYKQWSWDEDWRKEALRANYGERYRWAGKYLGNCNHANGGPIKLANPAIGIKRLDQYLNDSRFAHFSDRN